MSTLSQWTGNTIEITEIPKNTEVKGSLTSRANIKIAGSVKGDVTSDASIMISGTVQGDVTGDYVSIQNGRVSGNVTSRTLVLISEKSEVEGDIICDRLNLNGDVKGNVQAQSAAAIGNIAVIHGNLASQYLSIQEGAIVDGLIRVERENESSEKNLTSSPFPQTFV